MTISDPFISRSWRHRFWQQKRVKWIATYLALLIGLALLAPILCSDLPFSCQYQGQQLHPFWNPDQLIEVEQPRGAPLILSARQIDWHELELAESSWPLFPYRRRARIAHRELSPFGIQTVRGGKRLTPRMRHWLGTDQAGRDILALILHGIHISLGIGVLGTLLAGLTGFLIGSLAGYFGDDRLRIPGFLRWSLLPVGFLGLWLGFIRKSPVFAQADGLHWWGEFLLSLGIMVVICAILWGTIYLIVPKSKGRATYLKIDFFISRVIEVLDSLPQLLLIISLGAILSRDLWTFFFLLTLTSWSGVARLVRAETLRLRDADYIKAARISNIPNVRILWRHIWPQVLPMLLIPLAFGVGNIIIAESSLSFLGIIEDSQSWGSILSEAVHIRRVWWLPVVPGMAIFLTVLAINVLGESLRKALAVTT